MFTLLLWLVLLTEQLLGVDFYLAGVYPRAVKGIPGILLSPLVHADIRHLFSNSVPLLILGSGIIFFYRSLSYRVFAIVWIATGVFVWIIGRPSYHIGASGLVYGLASFLFFSGAIRREPRLAAISLVVVFLYGGMFWGVLPIWNTISWEGHLTGGLTGWVCAIAYRHHGPKRRVYSWEVEDENDNDIADEDDSPFLTGEPGQKDYPAC